MSAPNGWYQDNHYPNFERFYQNGQWTESIRPKLVVSPTPAGPHVAVTAGVAAGGVLGFTLTLQTVSLLTGAGLIWCGVAITAFATVLGISLGGMVKTAVKVGVVILFLFGLMNAVSVESQLDQHRQEIEQSFNTP